MKIGIIAAMEEELSRLVDSIGHYREIQFGQFKYYTSEVDGVEVALFLCGIGKVNASVGTTLLIDKLKPDCLINTGVAGGVQDNIQIGDIVVSSEVRHHDADATAFDYEFGQIPSMPPAFTADERLVTMARHVTMNDPTVRIHYGPVVSGDSFIHDANQVERITERFPSTMAVEMEGAAIAQTSYLFGIPFVLIRSISDRVQEDGSSTTYTQCMEQAAENSVGMVLGMIDNLREENTWKR
ncbi:MAG: 5'-methylthioadenosine/adenosylhomocysteine nucleosidase [Desulfobacterium sp.]|nr:5'-methylthioadenosine/adenosylhomocysteine nucleosidase [Desulfobacterium sp.]